MRSRRNTCNRKPCTHDNDGYRTSVTVAGKRCFPPLSLRSPLSFPVARCAIISAPFSFSPLHICLRFHAAFRTASVCHFRCWGKGKDGIRNTNFLSKNLHALSGVVFYRKILPNGVEIFSKTEGSTFYFQSPLPYLCTCTITVDAKRKDHVEERKSERQMKIETSRKFLDCTIIAYSFLRNGYNYCLANIFRKMEIAYKNGTAFREIPVKEEYGLSMLLASGFLQGCAAKHESGR